jgi:hypothetical protein
VIDERTAPLRIEAITVYRDRLEAVVRVYPPMTTRGYPHIAERALRILPGLEKHACVNDGQNSAVEELADTEVAHLLEHVTLEIATAALPGLRLKGDTSWDFKRDGYGVFRVTVDCPDDAVLLGSLKAAVQIMFWLTDTRPGGPAPDVAGTIERLRTLHPEVPRAPRSAPVYRKR